MTGNHRSASRWWNLADLLPAFPADLLIVRLFLIALAALLAGYQFMGRGFAHVGAHPIYVGEVVLALGLITAVVVIVRRRPRLPRSWTIVLLALFMLLGAARTIPYIGIDGFDALRDGVLWGYAAFALLIYLVVDRQWIVAGLRLYALILPLFALWLPFAWIIFQASQIGLDPTRPGLNHPLVFFKAGDMAIHAVAAIAFVVVAPPAVASLRDFGARVLVSLPLSWTILLTASASRGAILGAATGVGAAVVATRHRANWAPVAVATLAVLIWLNAGLIAGPSPSPTPTPTASASPSPSTAPSPTEPGRDVSAGQLLENFVSIFGSSSDPELEGTKAFRLAWWSAIVEYTVFGRYFWTGKGFGVNLADDDGFQPTLDHSLRAPHNSHMSVLARMGVPGFVLWVLLQSAFAFGLLRAVRSLRRELDLPMAGVGAWVLVVWATMMVVTSFDPYLEGPQGGIWFWTIFGLGLAIIRLAHRPIAA